MTKRKIMSSKNLSDDIFPVDDMVMQETNRNRSKYNMQNAPPDFSEEVDIAEKVDIADDQNENINVGVAATTTSKVSGISLSDISVNMVRNESDFSRVCSFQQWKDNVTDTFHVIIDNPEVTMKQELIDSNIVEIVNQVLNNKDMIGPRSNAFFAIVTGMGRGKTRTLVEMNRELNSRAGVLSVAITYNDRWERRIVDESLPTSLKYLEYPLSVVTRILSVHYRLQHANLVRNVKDYLLTTSINQKDKVDTPLFLIRECIRYIIRQQRENYIVVEKFVLLVDESGKIEKDLKDEKVHSVLRQALLDVPLFHGTSEEPVEVELVMSCLNINSTGITSSSSRPIHTITIPEVLTPQSVLDHWWMVNVTVTLTRENIFKLLKLISTMNGLPRALQYGASKFEELANRYLNSLSSTSSTSHWNIDKATITELYEAVRTTVSHHYPLMKKWNLSSELTKALLFCEEIPVNKEVMKVVSQGIFTNSLTVLVAEGDTSICPKTTMLAMDIMSLSYTDGVPLIIRTMVDKLLINIMTGDTQAGDPLVIISNGLINARLLSLVKSVPSNQISNFNISQLFLINNSYDIQVENNNEEHIIQSSKRFLAASHEVSESDVSFYSKSMILRKSYCDSNRRDVGRLFLTDANKPVPANDNIVKLALDSAECADGGWLFRSSSNQLSTLMIDARCLKELMPDEVPNPRLPPFNTDHALHFNKLTKKISSLRTTRGFKVNEGSMTHSILRKDTLFVYIMTRNQITTIGDRLLIVGDSDMRKFLAFMEPFYGIYITISTHK